MSSGLKYTFLVHAVVAFVFGVGLVLAPEWLRERVNWTSADPAMARAYGTALLAICLSSWLGFRAEEWKQVRIIVRMENAFTIIGFLTGLYTVLFADGPSFVWSSVVISAVFGVLFGYFGRAPQAKAVPAPQAAH